MRTKHNFQYEGRQEEAERTIFLSIFLAFGRDHVFPVESRRQLILVIRCVSIHINLPHTQWPVLRSLLKPSLFCLCYAIYSPAAEHCSSWDGNQRKSQSKGAPKVLFCHTEGACPFLTGFSFTSETSLDHPCLYSLCGHPFPAASTELKQGKMWEYWLIAIKGFKETRLGKDTGTCTSVHLSIWFLHALGTSCLPPPWAHISWELSWWGSLWGRDQSLSRSDSQYDRGRSRESPQGKGEGLNRHLYCTCAALLDGDASCQHCAYKGSLIPNPISSS